MFQQDTVRRARRSHSIHTALVCLVVGLVMSAGSVHAASVDVVDTSKDRAVHGWWEFVFGSVVAGCTVTSEGLYISTTSQSDDLEAATGVTSTEDTLSDFIDALPQASSGTFVRFEGGIPDAETVAALDLKGYTVAAMVPASEGFDICRQFTD